MQNKFNVKLGFVEVEYFAHCRIVTTKVFQQKQKNNK